MADAPQPTPRRLGRWGRVALFVSLAMNLVIVGVIVGSLAIDGPRGSDRRPPRASESGLGPVLTALSVEDRRALGRAMRQSLRGQTLSRAETRALIEDVIVALQADPFDVTAVDSLLDLQVQDVELRLTLARRLFLERLSDMDAAERATFATRLQEVLDTPPGERRGLGEGRPAKDRE